MPDTTDATTDSPALVVRLIGRPCLESPSGPVAVRGQKPWALLARLVLSDRPVSRRQLAAELFGDADDPLGALRWTLAGLRRALGSAEVFTGDPVSGALPGWVTVDALDIDGDERGAVDVLDGIGAGELLEGIDVRTGPEFETWLLVARQHVASRVAARIRDEVIGALGRGDHRRALRLAEAAARRAPLDEGAQILLVKSLAMAGHEAAAAEHVAAVRSRFVAELGVEPSPALHSAARGRAGDTPIGVSPAVVARNLIESGRSAIQVGAIDAGLDCLRRAADRAEAAADGSLLSRALFELGSALVHAIRGHDDEGAVLLEQAAAFAREAGDVECAVAALRERGYADALAGRRPEAQGHLESARELAGDVPALLAGVLSVEAFNLADWGRVEASLDRYAGAVEASRRAADRRQEAWALGLGAWARLAAGDAEGARSWSAHSIDVVREMQWRSFEPWPVAVLHEASGRFDESTAAEACFAMSCELDDPCWEGASGRLLALHHARSGDLASALRWIDEAAARSTRKSDAWVGLVGEILMTKAELLARAGDAHDAAAAARHAVSVAAAGQLDGLLPRGLRLLSPG